MVKMTLKEALGRLEAQELTPYAGGTDLMVKPGKKPEFLYIGGIEELKGIRVSGGSAHIGAGCTFTEILESAAVPDYFKLCVSQIAAPAIRNMGTLGGNIANGSAKADTLPTLFAVNASLRLVSAAGEREVPLRAFASSEASLEKGELIAEAVLPVKAPEVFMFEKVGGREALAISRVSFAGAMSLESGRISAFSAVFGAVAKKVLSMPEADAMLIGKTPAQASALRDGYLEAVSSAMELTEGRVSAGYRKFACMNLLEEFLRRCGI